MINKRILHWIIIEESKDGTTFEGSLHSKMSTLILNQKILDKLKCKRSINNIRMFLAVLKKEVRKQSNPIRNYINKERRSLNG
ncbi:hypothetical protein LCGC14_1365150 [marine sediment metagenome]|uniref:Uncharacterized protein n=1 Tax=marine sediment metagenome TaxID=412755 RepID=A0A0F9K7G9_9ZZZZ